MANDRSAIMSEAQKFVAKGQFDKAIAEWKKLLKDSPNDPNIYNTIGDLSLKKNSKAEAVDAYTRAADMLAADGFSSKAIALYKKVLNIDPKKIEAHLALGDLNAEKGLTGNALESYKIVADHYTQKKETAKVLGIYQKMADLNASNVAFRLKLADMYAKEGMKKEGVAAYLQAADVHISKSAFKDARQLFEKALSLDPDSKEVYHKAGLVYFKEGKFAEACKALKPAVEADPANAELAELYVDALVKAGRGAEAEEVYRKILDARPEDSAVREKLYRFYLEQKEYDKAFSEVSSLANIKIEDKDLDGAEELLKGFLAEAPRTVDGRRALSALYKTVGKPEEAANVLVEAAKILIEDGDNDPAQDLLARAVELAPGHDEAKGIMQGLKPPSVQEPEPDIPAEEPRPVQPEQAPPRSASARPASKAPAALLEDPVIAEALAEVDVLVKYGLPTKAIEQLETLVKTNPKNLQIRMKLRDLYGDLGNMSKAVAHMLVLADLFVEHGMQARADEVLEAARGMDPNNAAFVQEAGGEASPMAPVLDDSLLTMENEDAVELAPEALQDLAPESLQDLSFPEPQELSLDEVTPAPDLDEIQFDQPFTPPDFGPGDQERAEEPSVVSEAEDAPDQAIHTPSAEFPIPTEPGSGFEEGAAVPEAAAPPAKTVEQETDLSEVWAEAEFYYQQGLFDEARKHYEKILEANPGNSAARARLAELSKDQEEAQEFSKLADAVDGLEGLEGAGFAAAQTGTAEALSFSSSDEEAVRSLMQEIAQLKQKTEAPRQQPPVQSVFGGRSEAERVSGPAPGRSEEDFFDLGEELKGAGAIGSFSGDRKADSSDDFFDLASELRDELSSASIPEQSAPSEEQSLDDIFEEFKKGVEQQAIKEDSDTHYNLGIAYKEMGLLDDAIGEFVMTPEDEPKFFQSRYMLGLCYMEKGDYQNAIAEMQVAQATADGQGRSESDRVSIAFDLGLAFQGMGNSENALLEFNKVFSIDPSYRDIADKIRELEQGGGISLDQIKTDIEKEISSKFLEEGERIEREEKTKKNERVSR